VNVEERRGGRERWGGEGKREEDANNDGGD
jgi:hypothetical protein